jgi:hypothetical protein
MEFFISFCIGGFFGLLCGVIGACMAAQAVFAADKAVRTITKDEIAKANETAAL